MLEYSLNPHSEGSLAFRVTTYWLVFCKLRPSNCKGDERNWHEFNISGMVDVKTTSRVGAKQHVIAMK